MIARWLRIAAVTVTLGATSAGAVAGQVVRGVAVDAADAPVPGVVVLLLDGSSKATAARALTNERGEYRLATPRPGTYEVHTLRIGFRPVASEPVSLASGQEVTRCLVLTGVPL